MWPPSWGDSSEVLESWRDMHTEAKLWFQGFKYTPEPSIVDRS